MLDAKYQHFTPAELTYQYMPVRTVDNIHTLLGTYTDLSKHQHNICVHGTFHIAYGDMSTQTYDFWSPTVDNTGYLYVFIHGGYWRLLGKNDSAWMVGGLQQAGCSVAVLDYTLCPENSIAGIVQECQNAITHLVKNSERLGFEKDKILLCGSSAGGHLVTMMALTDWQKFGINDPIRGIVPVSGLFDLNPLVVIDEINKDLKLSFETAENLSPQRIKRVPNCPVVIAWGQYDTPEFIRQSKQYAQHLRTQGVSVTTLEVADKNHFDVILDFGIHGTDLMQSALDLIVH